MSGQIEFGNGRVLVAKEDASVVAGRIAAAETGALVYVVPASGNLGVYVNPAHVLLVREMPR